jgi:hypothetical protein
MSYLLKLRLLLTWAGYVFLVCLVGRGIQRPKKQINKILKPLKNFSRSFLENSFINCAIENTENRSEKVSELCLNSSLLLWLSFGTSRLHQQRRDCSPMPVQNLTDKALEFGKSRYLDSVHALSHPIL